MAGIDKSTDSTKTICWARADNDEKVFTIRDAVGAALDVSTWTFTMSVDQLLDPPSAATLQFAIIGAFVTDGTDGRVQFTPAALDTDIAPGEYFYDIQRNTPTIKTLIKGTVEIVQDITKT